VTWEPARNAKCMLALASAAVFTFPFSYQPFAYQLWL
jgi:hypothetical protein